MTIHDLDETCGVDENCEESKIHFQSSKKTQNQQVEVAATNTDAQQVSQNTKSESKLEQEIVADLLPPPPPNANLQDEQKVIPQTTSQPLNDIANEKNSEKENPKQKQDEKPKNDQQQH